MKETFKEIKVWELGALLKILFFEDFTHINVMSPIEGTFFSILKASGLENFQGNKIFTLNSFKLTNTV